MHSHRCAEEAVWSQMAVVYEVYFGKEDPILKDADFSEVERLVSRQRLWAVMGSNRHDLRQRLEGAGGQVVLAQVAVKQSNVIYRDQRVEVSAPQLLGAARQDFLQERFGERELRDLGATHVEMVEEALE